MLVINILVRFDLFLRASVVDVGVVPPPPAADVVADFDSAASSPASSYASSYPRIVVKDSRSTKCCFRVEHCLPFPYKRCLMRFYATHHKNHLVVGMPVDLLTFTGAVKCLAASTTDLMDLLSSKPTYLVG